MKDTLQYKTEIAGSPQLREMAAKPQFIEDPMKIAFEQERIAHWNKVTIKMGGQRRVGKYYLELLTHIYRNQVSAGQKVLEIGCGNGDLLAALKPSLGLGIDFSGEILHIARQRHPSLQFKEMNADALYSLEQSFDVIILSDLLNDVWDVQTVLEQVKFVSNPGTRIILNFYSRVWEKPLSWAAYIGLARPKLLQNWLTVNDLYGLMHLAGFDVIRSWQEILMPLPIPLLSYLFNRYLVKLWPFKYLALTNFIIARTHISRKLEGHRPKVSVIVPARNEAGNIENILNRVPEMGSGTELIFVEGHSSDNTFETIQEALKKVPANKAILFQQSGKGKGDAVRLGFSKASGEILMILDADLTVPPEDLPRFYNALISGHAEFVNGVRLVYPMEEKAMRFFNLLGNKFFSYAFTWLLGQNIKDTLCGTKVLWKKDYERIAANRQYFGNFDPFGDFDLLFGAAKLNLKIIDLPIRYRERKYGETNIQRWSHGLLLLKMVLFAARRIKFI